MAKCPCGAFITTALILCCLITSPCFADEIEYTFAGIGSGTIGTTTFSQEPFTINAFANTANTLSFETFYADSRPGFSPITLYGAFVLNDSSSVTIATVGTFQFTDPGQTTVNNSKVSFGQHGASYVQSSSDFASWNLTSPLNTTTSMNNLQKWQVMETDSPLPTSLPTPLQPAPLQVQSRDVETDGGTIVFNDSNSSTNFTFSATIVPEPSTLTLLCLGSLGLNRFWYRRAVW